MLKIIVLQTQQKQQWANCLIITFNTTIIIISTFIEIRLHNHTIYSVHVLSCVVKININNIYTYKYMLLNTHENIFMH
jgi:hypothetical protein